MRRQNDIGIGPDPLPGCQFTRSTGHEPVLFGCKMERMANIPAASGQLLEIWSDLSASERLQRFRSLDATTASEVFVALDTRDQAELILLFASGERAVWLRMLPPDDLADLIQDVPLEVRELLLSALDSTSRREVTALLAYAEDAAGGLMNPRYARLRPEMSIDDAIAYLRRQAPDIETIYYAYVLGADQRLLGVVSFRDLFSSDRTKTVNEVMRPNPIAVREADDQEAVAHLFSVHHLLAIPVIDMEGRMMGIVTVDDIVEVLEKEVSEDFQKIGGMQALREAYLHVPFRQMVWKRGGWLMVLFLGETLTATAMGYFQEDLARAVVLALFIPLIISSGGNSGSQATTLVIRALSVGELQVRDWWRVMRRELSVGLILGGVLAGIGALRIVLWQALWSTYGHHYVQIALVVSASLIAVVLLGTLAGSMLPFALRRLRLDPATASAPFVATLVDVSGVVMYFMIARAILRGAM